MIKVVFMTDNAYEKFKSNFRAQKDAQFKLVVLQNSDVFRPLLCSLSNSGDWMVGTANG
jgi:hypothetical protein